MAAGLTLSGVAVAGIGATAGAPDGPTQDDRGTPRPVTRRRRPVHRPVHKPVHRRSGGPGHRNRPPGPPGPPEDGRGHRGPLPRLRAGAGRGKALDSTAWKRLTEAAGGA
ncbi:hypothetical protein GCM10023238_12240 [Streptomyces heliomycini]